ncbi:MAG: response regulator transcription factor [Candidatus Omnitrophota bacterium]
MRLLLVEDEIKVASFIARGLKEENYVVDVADDGEKALFLAEVNPYDLIILDIILPRKDGISVCKELRRKKINVPILMLTSKDLVSDKVMGLNAGADDYLTKPFAFEELLARAGALLRRGRADKTGILKVADLEVDPSRHKVTRAGKEIMLTAKEFALLEYLMLNADCVVSRTMISEHVWHENFDSFTNVIDVYVSFLRNKIDKGQAKQLIHTVQGKGYVLRG